MEVKQSDTDIVDADDADDANDNNQPQRWQQTAEQIHQKLKRIKLKMVICLFVICISLYMFFSLQINLQYTLHTLHITHITHVTDPSKARIPINQASAEASVGRCCRCE